MAHVDLNLVLIHGDVSSTEHGYSNGEFLDVLQREILRRCAQDRVPRNFVDPPEQSLLVSTEYGVEISFGEEVVRARHFGNDRISK